MYWLSVFRFHGRSLVHVRDCADTNEAFALARTYRFKCLVARTEIR